MFDQELIEKSRELGFNLSKTFENTLKHLINTYSNVNSLNNNGNSNIRGDWWAGPDLDPNGFESAVSNILNQHSLCLRPTGSELPVPIPKLVQDLLSAGKIVFNSGVIVSASIAISVSKISAADLKGELSCRRPTKEFAE